MFCRIAFIGCVAAAVACTAEQRLEGGSDCMAVKEDAELGNLGVHLLQTSVSVSKAAAAETVDTATGMLQESGISKERSYSRGVMLVKQLMLPTVALLLGALLMACKHSTPGVLALFFGGGGIMNLYMKLVLSEAVLSKELGLKGVQAGFIVTALQQLVAFAFMSVAIGALYFTPWRYVPRRLQSWNEVMCVLVFSCTFAMNVSLNNISLSLMDISLNTVIRSCTPIAVLMVQGTFGVCIASLRGKTLSYLQYALLFFGVICAALTTVAKTQGSHHSQGSQHLLVGLIAGISSTVASAANFILAAMFGKDLKLNPVDTVFYMAVPCAIFLLPFAFTAKHPVDWPGYGLVTDFTVIQKMMEVSPATMGLVLFSGVLAAGYNVLQYTVVQHLSATHTSLAGNFNKAGVVMISICMGMETLPGGGWSSLMLVAILGNIVSFAVFSSVKSPETPACKDEGRQNAFEDCSPCKEAHKRP